jgi:chemotaxis protein methyltransferase CheR
MQKIFSNDPDFELVGTAANGKEAEEFLKAHKVDAMTLDIHMPEMNGVEYLQKNFKSGHPHVVMVSSASREDSRFSLAALEAGAADFVEKPALNNLAEKADEIKLKLKLAFFNQGSAKKINTSLHTDYKIENCDKKLRIFVTTYGDRQKTLQTIKSLSGYKGQNPPSIVLLDGGNQFFDQFKKELDQLGPTKLLQNGQSLEINGVYFADFGTSFDSLKTSLTNRYTVICCFGLTTKKVSDWILSLNEVDLLLEDITAQSNHLKDVATDLFPWTSFAHVSTELLAKKSLK